MKLTQKQVTEFQKLIHNYYKVNKRDLAWRNTSDPYKILVSEIMLQQTQVNRVCIKYQEFINRFPTFTSLSQASLADVLSVWQGMGYNRRALYLKKISEEIKILPNNYEQLIHLPGIGKNTAGSLLAFAFNKPVVFIETNIRRVFIHHFFKDKENILDQEILPLVEQTLDISNPKEWYYALMDYGTYLSKIVENPNRKSKHYIKQSPLKGSIREARGKILKVLLPKKNLSLTTLQTLVDLPDTFSLALDQLSEEGFITIKNGIISINLEAPDT